MENRVEPALAARFLPTGRRGGSGLGAGAVLEWSAVICVRDVVAVIVIALVVVVVISAREGR